MTIIVKNKWLLIVSIIIIVDMFVANVIAVDDYRLLFIDDWHNNNY